VAVLRRPHRDPHPERGLGDRVPAVPVFHVLPETLVALLTFDLGADSAGAGHALVVAHRLGHARLWAAGPPPALVAGAAQAVPAFPRLFGAPAFARLAAVRVDALRGGHGSPAAAASRSMMMLGRYSSGTHRCTTCRRSRMSCRSTIVSSGSATSEAACSRSASAWVSFSS